VFRSDGRARHPDHARADGHRFDAARGARNIETAAVVTRMAPSFVRFGSFEHWHYRNKPDELKLLADYVIGRFYPRTGGEPKIPIKALLAKSRVRTARMIAHWQAVGFMHGVMNTDNMSILGLTLDYGPFGFMEAFDVDHICNHTDQQGAIRMRTSRRSATGTAMRWRMPCCR
jgi:uncharacterized protein YdiU (UPF0061 family)